MSTVLLTGSAGFIGFHVAKFLLERGHSVTGLDSLSDYYDVELKQDRTSLLQEYSNFTPIVGNICDKSLVNDIFQSVQPETVFHLAAQAGVRDSISNPRIYFESNLQGTFELLEAARSHRPKHLIIASTSSVYGANGKQPFQEADRADHQISFYAASKKATENLAHSYSHTYGLPTTVCRFFTVYGPWGRPDMALFKFTRNIMLGQPIEVYNNGNLERDFTYIDDVCQILMQLMDAAPDTAMTRSATMNESPVAPFRLLNIGSRRPVALIDFIKTLEQAIGIPAQINFLSMQPGDMKTTWSDNSALTELIGPQTYTDIEVGIRHFVEWYRGYYAK